MTQVDAESQVNKAPSGSLKQTSADIVLCSFLFSFSDRSDSYHELPSPPRTPLWSQFNL